MFVKFSPSMRLRVALVCAVIAQMFAAFPVSAAGNTAAGRIENLPSVLIATPTPVLYTLILQPDSAGGIDTYIYSGSKNANYGNALEIGVGEDNNSSNRVARSLLKFDLSSIPSNATVTAATLSLWTSTDLSNNTRTIRVYRLKTSFQETQATWNGPAAGMTWQTAGASGSNDRENTAIGSISILSNEALNREKQIVLQPTKIQEMVAGTFVNRGFILVADTEQNDRFNYQASDSASSNQRPRLVVQYSVSSVAPSEEPTVIQTPVPTITSTFQPTTTQTATPIPSATTVPSNTPSATGTAPATATSSPTYMPLPTTTFTPPPTATPSLIPTLQPDTPTSTPISIVNETSTPVGQEMGPLAVSSVNPRYFAKQDGKIVYLTGTHTWCNFMDCGGTDPIITTFDYNAYLDFLIARNHNFFRLWRAENARGGEAGPNFWFNPMPYQRSDTCCAFDGGNKFDLTQFNQSYFDRLRQRLIEAGNKGIYVSIMLFDGWSVESKFGGHNPWAGHPYNVNNNANGIDGDMNDDNQGGETHTLSSSQITALQEAYVRKVIDSVNDLDNVLYEISNESTGSTANTQWQYHLIDYIKSYEAAKPKQHPVGMTATWPNYNANDLYNSPADWISLGSNVNLNTYVPPVATGNKVILADTDHLCGICGNRQWVWKSFTRGENPIFMDVYNFATSSRGMDLDPTGSETEIRANLGYTRSFADRMNLSSMVPQPNLCSSGFCLARTGAEYLAYLPSGTSITVDLSGSAGSFNVEWFNPVNGSTVNGGSVNGGSTRSFTSPFSADAVLYLRSGLDVTPTPQTSSTPTWIVSSSPLPTGTVVWPTSTATLSCTPSYTETAIPTLQPTMTMTRTVTATRTPTSIPTVTQTFQPSNTPSPTLTFTPTPTRTFTATSTPIPTLTGTASGGFPITQVRDTFDRVNGTIGASWSGYTSAFRIASNKLDVNASGWNTSILWQGSSFGADQEAYVTFSQVDTGSNEQSLILKSQSSTGTTTGLIYILYDGAGRSVQVWTYHPTQDWVQYGAAIPVTFVAGDQLGARARPDGTVEVYKNGTLLGTRTITSWPYYANSGYIGLWFVNAPYALLDNFGGGTR